MLRKISSMALLACFMTIMTVQQGMAARPQVTDTIDNTVTATYDDASGTAMTPVVVTVSVDVLQVYSVTVAPATDSATGPANGYVSYAVTVTNTGNGADTFDLTNDHQSGAWSPFAVEYFSDSLLTAPITDTGSLAADGGNVTVYAKLTIPAGALDGTTSVDRLTATSANDPSGTPASAYDEVTTSVGQADLTGSTKTADDTNYVAGETVTYTITLDNTAGSLDASSIVVTDQLPTELTFVSTSIGSYDGPSRTITVNYGTLAAGATDTITVTATVNGGTADGTVVSNTAHITYSSGLNPETPLDRSVNVTVDAPHLVVTKVPDKASAAPGETITYTITVTNDGAADATNVSITDALSNFVENVVILGGASNCAPVYNGPPPGGSIDGNPTAGTIAAGGSMSFQYTVDVDDTP